MLWPLKDLCIIWILVVCTPLKMQFCQLVRVRFKTKPPVVYWLSDCLRAVNFEVLDRVYEASFYECMLISEPMALGVISTFDSIGWPNDLL